MKTQMKIFWQSHNEVHLANCRKGLELAEKSGNKRHIEIAKENLSEAINRKGID